MDTRNAPPSPGSAVSGLMQQLKSGEISKMQLFQQIAKLQAASATPSASSTPTVLPAPPAPSASAAVMPLPSQSFAAFRTAPTPPPAPLTTTASMIFSGGALAPSTVSSTAQQPASVPFVTFNYSPPRAPVPPVTASQAKATNSSVSGSQRSAVSPSSTARAVAQPVASDAEIMASGVSHDKAQRLSVQEWIASKTRAAASATAFTATPSLFAPQPTGGIGGSQMFGTTAAAGPSLFSFLGQAQPQQPEYSTAATQPSTNAPFHSNAQANSQWGQNPSSGNFDGQQDTRYEDEDNHNYGAGGNDYMNFDPFQDDGRHANDGPTSNGGKNNGGGGGDDAKFHARVTRWKSQKDAVREQMKQQLLQSELDECTFAPKVNPKSTKVVAKLRGRQRSVGGGDSDGGLSTAGAFAVSERLYQEADNYKAREELAAKLKAEEEAELQRECTFRPKINKNNPITEKVKPKYMDISRKDAPVITPAAIEAAAKELEQCTFTPQVNAVSHEMVSAQLYLQQNIYERLSRPCVATGGDSDVRGVMGDDSSNYEDDLDMLTSPGRARFHAQDDMYVRSRRRRGSHMTSRQQAGSTHRPRSAGGIVTDEEKAERARQFEDFLERQKFHEQARKKKIEVTQQQLVAPHRPSINKNSVMMMENGRKGDFLERITKYAIRKEQDTVKNKTVRVSDPNCTFKPAINAHSSKRSGRSVTELSRGDLLRRETTQRLMKLKMEQEEMASLTFRPQLSRASQHVEGRLKILSSPDTYLQRIQQQSQAHIIKQRRAVQEKEMEEFSECTFKPRTIEAPAYVQRIARSVVLTKALKKQQEANAKANQKPEWK